MPKDDISCVSLKTICDSACRANIFCCLANAAVTLYVCLIMSLKRKAISNIKASKKTGYTDKYLNTTSMLQKGSSRTIQANAPDIFCCPMEFRSTKSTLACIPIANTFIKLIGWYLSNQGK